MIWQLAGKRSRKREDLTAERGFNPSPPVPPERVAESEIKKESHDKKLIPEPAEKLQDDRE